jgi:hypothetical protein
MAERGKSCEDLILAYGCRTSPTSPPGVAPHRLCQPTKNHDGEYQSRAEIDKPSGVVAGIIGSSSVEPFHPRDIESSTPRRLSLARGGLPCPAAGAFVKAPDMMFVISTLPAKAVDASH